MTVCGPNRIYAGNHPCRSEEGHYSQWQQDDTARTTGTYLEESPNSVDLESRGDTIRYAAVLSPVVAKVPCLDDVHCSRHKKRDQS
jgi:hypothetical protein